MPRKAKPKRFATPKPTPVGTPPRKGMVWNEDYGWVRSLKKRSPPKKKTKAQKRAARIKKLNAAVKTVVLSSAFETNRRKH